MDDDEYQRMVAAGERHWWYRSTRSLLESLIVPYLLPIDGTSIYLDAGGGSGATGSWLADRATTVLDDFETVALQAAVRDHPAYRSVQADINRVPHPMSAFDAVLCVTALCHRMNPDPQAIVDEFARTIRQELDYRIEARNVEATRRAFAGDPTVTVPPASQSPEDWSASWSLVGNACGAAMTRSPTLRGASALRRCVR